MRRKRGCSGRNFETQRKVGNGDSQLAPLEVISSLVTRLLRTAQEDRLADVKVPPEEGMGSSSAVTAVVGAEKYHSVWERARVCFSCGRPGHGVNRCSQVDTSFPFLSQGWSVDVRNGQYRAIRTGGTGKWSTPGNEGWSGREGQPPGSSGTKVQLTPAGELVDRRDDGMAAAGGEWAWTRLGFEHAGFSTTEEPSRRSSWQDNRKLPVRAKVVLGNRNLIVPISPVGMGRGSSWVVPQVPGARKHGRGMRPARWDRRSPQRVKDDRMNTKVVPLSVEAEEFSLRTVSKIRMPTGVESDGSENCVPSREMHGGVVERSDAVVSTTAVVGAAAPSDFAGTAAPADLAGTDVPVVAGMKFLAVAGVHSSAVDDEGAPLVIRTSKQPSAVVEVDPVWAEVSWPHGRYTCSGTVRVFGCWSAHRSGR